MRSLLAIVNVLGTLLALFAAYYLLPIATALIYGEAEALHGVPALRRRHAGRGRACCCWPRATLPRASSSRAMATCW